MVKPNHLKKYKDKIVTPDKVISRIKPGMSIFLSTGLAEPRTMVKELMASDAPNLQDLELVQMVSLGDAVQNWDLANHGKYRLKTFFAGWVASEAITRGRVDLIPSRMPEVPQLIESGSQRIDVALVLISPPDEAGYASLGVSVDVARQAMESASIVVGEVHRDMPRTLGDTFVHMNDFDLLVESNEPMYYLPRADGGKVFDRVAENVAGVIEDGACLLFSPGPLFDALAPHLARKKNLGIHSPFFTDAVMDLVKSGAVTNRNKSIFRGKCCTSYALGSKQLMSWLHRNPLIEFQAVDVVGDPDRIRRNSRFSTVIPARKVDVTGQFAYPYGRGNVGLGPSEAGEFITGARMSEHGLVIVALPSRNRKGEPKILLSLEGYPNQHTNAETVDMVVTEYGVANMRGRTVRERCLALIDISHPDDREDLVNQAKEHNILYKDQIYLAESGHMYPSEYQETETFKDGVTVRFRPIRPSDEDGMRQLFYRFSSEAVYYRYFSPIKTMPHSKMQEYVNVDYRKTMSIVGVVGESGQGKIVAEGRFVRLPDEPWADVAFVVDESYQGKGIATHLFFTLIKIARDRGIKGFTADVLSSNKSMMKVFEKAPYPVEAKLEGGTYHLRIPFENGEQDRKERISYGYDRK
ncbi:MAG: GNAT family N-acetyltransferase [Desulfatibacillaceae bacterium]